MKPKSLQIQCQKCHGTGRVEISNELRSVLELVKKNAPVSVFRVYNLLGNPYIGVTAINQRLEDLRKLGFVERERQGKAFFYTAAK